MKRFCLLLALLLMVCLPSCKGQDGGEVSGDISQSQISQDESTPTDGSDGADSSEETLPPDVTASDDAVTVNLSMLEGTVYDSIDPELPLMEYSYVYPRFSSEKYSDTVEKISTQYELEAVEYMEILHGPAAEDFSFIYHSGPEYYHKATYDCGVRIVYNENGLLSVLQQQFTSYEDGGYPSTFYTARTYDLTDGRLLTLEELTGLSMEEICLAAADGILEQIAQSPEGFHITDRDQLAYAVSRQHEYYLTKNQNGEPVAVVCLQEASLASYEKGAIFVELPAVLPE